MEEKFKIVFNLKDEMYKVFEKSFKEDGYEIIYKDENIVFIKKSERNLNNDQIARIKGMIKINKNFTNRIVFMDITEAVQYLMQKNESEIKNDVKFRWMIRQAFTKAILNNKR